MTQRLPNVYLSVFDRDFQIDHGTQPEVPVSCNCTALEWFDVTDYGAKGDGATDDGPAFQAAFDAMLAAGGGTVFVPPCSAYYQIVTGVGFSNAVVDTVKFIGSGSAGPIRIRTGSSTVAFDLYGGSGSEGFAGTCQDLFFITSNDTSYTTPGTADCQHVLYLRSEAYDCWTIRNVQQVGIWAQGACFRLGACMHIVENLQWCGGFAGPSGPTDYAVFLDHVTPADLKNVIVSDAGSYGGTTWAGGAALAAIGVDPEDNTIDYGNSYILIKNLKISSRITNAVAVLPSSTNRVQYLHIENVDFAQGTSGSRVILAQNVDTLIAKGMHVRVDHDWTTVELIACGRVSIEALVPVTGGVPAVVADSGTTSLQLIDCVPGTMTVASDAPAFWTYAGVKSRVRVSQAAIVANTIGKPGATAGRVDQLGTGDDSRLALGVVLDAASTSGTSVRVVEEAGQQVQIKSDGATTLTMADTLTSSGATAGYVKKTTTGGASTVGLATGAATNVTGTLLNMVWQRGQY